MNSFEDSQYQIGLQNLKAHDLINDADLQQLGWLDDMVHAGEKVVENGNNEFNK